MCKRNFMEMVAAQRSKDNWACVGYDPDAEKIPQEIRDTWRRPIDAIFAFNKTIAKATCDVAAASKPNSAFYERHGPEGMEVLHKSIRYMRQVAPTVPVILDAKRADIGGTNNGYVESAFGKALADADAITVNPYFGKEAMEPFLKEKDKGIIVLCRTSNPEAGEFQDLPVMRTREQLKELLPDPAVFDEFAGKTEFTPGSGIYLLPFYQIVAARVARYWNKNGNCALVVGATFPEELRLVRLIVGNMLILVPGYGAQGGKLEDIVPVGGENILINSSRGIMYAADPRKETETINQATKQLLKR